MNRKISLSLFMSFVVLITDWSSVRLGTKIAANQNEASAIVTNVDELLSQEETRSIGVTTPITTTLSYMVSDLGTLGGSYSYAYGINDVGQIIGRSSMINDYQRAFLWQNGVMLDLGTLGGLESYGAGINNEGHVVGWAELTNGYTHAFLWQNGLMLDLGTLGGHNSIAYDINNAEQVVGSGSLVNGHTHPFLWQNGGMSELGMFGGSAQGINDVGQVVGWAELVSGHTHAFLWQNDVMTDLGTLGGPLSYAYDINNVGQVVGSAYLANGYTHAFLWQNDVMIDLGTLGGSLSYAYSINNTGQVVGWAGLITQIPHAFVWQDENHNGLSEAGEMHDLNNLVPANSGWVLKVAYAINNNGQIAGWGDIGGETHAFLLTPTHPWTIMFYLDGDNDLASAYLPILNRLEAAADNPNVNIIVLWDGPDNGDSAYYHVQYDTDLNNLAQYTENLNYWPQGEVDMGSSDTLVSFANWARVTFPAQHYALTLHDHGNGLGGAMVDVTNNGNWINVNELGLALDQIALAGKIDVLNMTACLMGMIEDAYQWRNSVDYYVASENTMWAFEDIALISAMTEDSTPAEVANLFALAYTNVASAWGAPYTISSANIMQLNDVVTATNHLAELLNTQMTTISNALVIVASQVQRYDVNGNWELDPEDTYVDLYDFVYRMNLALPNHPDISWAAQAVMNAIDNYVIYENHRNAMPGSPYQAFQYNVTNSHGVSIFFPQTASSFYNASNYDFAVGANWPGNPEPPSLTQEAVAWGSMLVNYFQITQPGGPNNPTPPPPLPMFKPLIELFLPMMSRSQS